MCGCLTKIKENSKSRIINIDFVEISSQENNEI